MSGRDEEAPAPPGHTTAGKCLYDILWVLCRTLAVAIFGFRSRFVEPLPKTGPLIVLASHQTFLDPILLGVATDRRLSSLARGSLYRFKPFAALITLLDAIPIDLDASAVKAMKAVIARLKRGGAVTIFPEGARTHDGRPGEFKSGFALIAKRAAAAIVPVKYRATLDGRPLAGATVSLAPESFMGSAYTASSGTTAMSEQEIFDVCTRRIRDLDAKGRAALRLRK